MASNFAALAPVSLASPCAASVMSAPLFSKLDLTIGSGDRLGIVAANGRGKSTLLKCLTGEMEPTSGDITRTRGLRVGHGEMMTDRSPAAGKPIRTAMSVEDGIDFAIIELFFFAYRDFTSDPDQILADYGFGRAHHRVLHFVNRRPGLTVAELLDVLKITKQSLARVLKQLIDTDHGYFTRTGGVSTGIYQGLNIGTGSDDDKALVAENRARVAAWMGVPANHLLTA